MFIHCIVSAPRCGGIWGASLTVSVVYTVFFIIGQGHILGGVLVLPYRKLGVVFYFWRGPMMNHSAYSRGPRDCAVSASTFSLPLFPANSSAPDRFLGVGVGVVPRLPRGYYIF